MGKCDRTKGSGLRAVYWGNHNKACSFRFLVASLHLGDKDAPLCQFRGEDLSHEGLMTCFRGRSESPSISAISQIPLASNSSYQYAVSWGSRPTRSSFALYIQPAGERTKHKNLWDVSESGRRRWGGVWLGRGEAEVFMASAFQDHSFP